MTWCVKKNKTICFRFLSRRPHIRRSEVNFASPLYLQVPMPSPLWGANKCHFIFDSNIFFCNGFIIFHNSNVNLVARRKIGAPCKQIEYSWHDTLPAANQSSIPKRNKDKNMNSSQTFLTKNTFCQDLTYSLPTFFYFCVKEVTILRSHSVLT